jgi:hypothetical protein
MSKGEEIAAWVSEIITQAMPTTLDGKIVVSGLAVDIDTAIAEAVREFAERCIAEINATLKSRAFLDRGHVIDIIKKEAGIL